MMHQDVIRTLAGKISKTPRSDSRSGSRSRSQSNQRRKSLSMPALFQPLYDNNSNSNSNDNDVEDNRYYDGKVDNVHDNQDEVRYDPTTTSLSRLPFTSFAGNRSPEPENNRMMITHRKKISITGTSTSTSKRLKIDNQSNDTLLSPTGVENIQSKSYRDSSLPTSPENINTIVDDDMVDDADITFNPIVFPQDDTSELPAGLLKALYEDILLTQHKSLTMDNTANTNIAVQYDQIYLNDAGILSFEKVLLPAIAYQEDQLLKKIQSKIQRDQPELKPILVQCRKFVYKTIGIVIQAVTLSRLDRTKINQLLEQNWEEEMIRKITEEKKIRMIEKEQRKLERKQLKEIRRIKKIRERKKKFPQNLETWKEVAFLISELSYLQKDETKLDSGLRHINQRVQDLTTVLMEQEQQQTIVERNNDSLADKESIESSDDKNTISDEIIAIEQTFQDIIISTTRIDQGLKFITDIVDNSNTIRQKIYDEYTSHYQFNGYQGIHKPKELVLALSQSQPDTDWDDFI